VLIANGEGIAPHPVAREELALEIGGPEIVGRLGVRRDHAGMLMRPPAPTLLDQAIAGEEVPRGAHGGPRRLGDLGMPGPEPGEQLAGSPVRVRAPGAAQQVRDLLVDTVRTVMRGVAPILQAAPAVLVEPVEPLVAGLPANAVAGAELRSRVKTTSIVDDEPFALFHGCRLQPRHRPTSPTKGWPCSLQECHPSSRFEVLPINPVRTK
jgi:hypothetical protein